MLRINNQQELPVKVQGKDVEDITEFTYLGSKISQSGGTEEDIKARIKKAQQTFAILRCVWRSKSISTNTKIRIFNSNVKSTLLYGSETWRVTKQLIGRVQTFTNKCLRQILGIKWQDRVTNEEVWQRGRQVPIVAQIRKRKWGWIGHTLRKPEDNITRQALSWNPQGKRKRGRPRQTWRRSLMDDLKTIPMSWEAAKSTALDRGRWRVTIEALCSTRNTED